MRIRLAVLACTTLLSGCGRPAEAPPPVPPPADSPYLLAFAGDGDGAESDFLAVLDVRSGSPDRGKTIATTPIGMTSSMPHHMEYSLPPAGELLFMNAHHQEKAMLVDVSDARRVRIVKTFGPPAPLRFPHDFYRTPKGTRLAGFLRSEGPSPYPGETASPGNHGGIAEYRADGTLMRTASAASKVATKPVRPYAFALLPEIDRLVVTSAAMMEETSADVIQIYRYSDFTLLETLELPAGRLADGRVLNGSQTSGFGPRVLPDGSVFLNAYGCALYRLSDIASASPKLETVMTIDTPERAPGSIRGSCGIPIVFGNYWLQPVGRIHAVLVLDITNPSAPREVARLATPDTFNPHWLARDPRSNRLVLGAELGGEEGFYLLRFDDKSGRLSFDESMSSDGQAGYLSLKNQQWPHGATGIAWAHAALFLPQ